MKMQLILGIATVIAAAILLIYGMRAPLSSASPGWFIVGGLGLGVVGFYLLIVSFLSRGREPR